MLKIQRKWDLLLLLANWMGTIFITTPRLLPSTLIVVERWLRNKY